MPITSYPTVQEISIAIQNDRINKLEQQMTLLLQEKNNTFDENIKQKFKKYIISDYSLSRMVELDKPQLYKNYSEFLDWNMKCISELSKEKQNWLYELCIQINNNEIKLIDEESCSKFTACNIFFDQDKKLCIMNPR
jgi:transcriptional regulatory protein LevR